MEESAPHLEFFTLSLMAGANFSLSAAGTFLTVNKRTFSLSNEHTLAGKKIQVKVKVLV